MQIFWFGKDEPKELSLSETGQSSGSFSKGLYAGGGRIRQMDEHSVLIEEEDTIYEIDLDCLRCRTSAKEK